MRITENLDLCKMIDKIYRDMFCDFHEQYIIVFLCGGSSKRGEISVRDKIRPLLDSSKKYYYQMPIKTFYPEDLLTEELNRVKDADLLTYEQLLADNSHIIAIICESPGALVELVLHPARNYSDSTAYFTICRVVVSQRRNHSASLLRLAD